MKKCSFHTILLSAAICAGLAGCQPTTPQTQAQPVPAEAAQIDESALIDEINTVLDRQTEAWNDGDIDAFMQDYWQSENLRFASGGTVRTGWQNTLERYKKTYPDRAAMGTLLFPETEITIISPTDALVFGSWELVREADRPSGLYTLHMRKIDGDWVIVSDHTSSTEG